MFHADNLVDESALYPVALHDHIRQNRDYGKNSTNDVAYQPLRKYIIISQYTIEHTTVIWHTHTRTYARMHTHTHTHTYTCTHIHTHTHTHTHTHSHTQNPGLAETYTQHSVKATVARYAPSGNYIASGGNN